MVTQKQNSRVSAGVTRKVRLGQHQTDSNHQHTMVTQKQNSRVSAGVTRKVRLGQHQTDSNHQHTMVTQKQNSRVSAGVTRKVRLGQHQTDSNHPSYHCYPHPPHPTHPKNQGIWDKVSIKMAVTPPYYCYLPPPPPPKKSRVFERMIPYRQCIKLHIWQWRPTCVRGNGGGDDKAEDVEGTNVTLAEQVNHQVEEAAHTWFVDGPFKSCMLCHSVLVVVVVVMGEGGGGFEILSFFKTWFIYMFVWTPQSSRWCNSRKNPVTIFCEKLCKLLFALNRFMGFFWVFLYVT